MALHFLLKQKNKTTKLIVPLILRKDQLYWDGFGLVGGVATMLANAAGPVAQLYL